MLARLEQRIGLSSRLGAMAQGRPGIALAEIPALYAAIEKAGLSDAEEVRLAELTQMNIWSLPNKDALWDERSALGEKQRTADAELEQLRSLCLAALAPAPQTPEAVSSTGADQGSAPAVEVLLEQAKASRALTRDLLLALRRAVASLDDDARAEFVTRFLALQDEVAVPSDARALVAELATCFPQPPTAQEILAIMSGEFWLPREDRPTPESIQKVQGGVAWIKGARTPDPEAWHGAQAFVEKASRSVAANETAAWQAALALYPTCTSLALRGGDAVLQQVRRLGVDKIEAYLGDAEESSAIYYRTPALLGYLAARVDAPARLEAFVEKHGVQALQEQLFELHLFMFDLGVRGISAETFGELVARLDFEGLMQVVDAAHEHPTEVLLLDAHAGATGVATLAELSKEERARILADYSPFPGFYEAAASGRVEFSGRLVSAIEAEKDRIFRITPLAARKAALVEVMSESLFGRQSPVFDGLALELLLEERPEPRPEVRGELMDLGFESLRAASFAGRSGVSLLLDDRLAPRQTPPSLDEVTGLVSKLEDSRTLNFAPSHRAIAVLAPRLPMGEQDRDRGVEDTWLGRLDRYVDGELSPHEAEELRAVMAQHLSEWDLATLRTQGAGWYSIEEAQAFWQRAERIENRDLRIEHLDPSLLELGVSLRRAGATAEALRCDLGALTGVQIRPQHVQFLWQ